MVTLYTTRFKALWLPHIPLGLTLNSSKSAHKECVLLQFLRTTVVISLIAFITETERVYCAVRT